MGRLSVYDLYLIYYSIPANRKLFIRSIFPPSLLITSKSLRPIDIMNTNPQTSQRLRHFGLFGFKRWIVTPAQAADQAGGSAEGAGRREGGRGWAKPDECFKFGPGRREAARARGMASHLTHKPRVKTSAPRGAAACFQATSKDTAGRKELPRPCPSARPYFGGKRGKGRVFPPWKDPPTRRQGRRIPAQNPQPCNP